MEVFLTEYQLSELDMEISKLKFVPSRKKRPFISVRKKIQTSDRNASLQFVNKVKAPSVSTVKFIRILLPSISNDTSDSTTWKDKDSLHTKEELSLDNSATLTSNSCSLNNCTKAISYKSTSINSNDTKASNCQAKYTILDKLGFENSSLQD